MLPPRSRNPRNRDVARKLRREASKSELLLRSRLSRSQLGFSFRFQYPVLTYILDFYCPGVKVCVEVDGEQHDPNADAVRDQKLEELGILTIRVASVDLWDDKRLDEILSEIQRVCAERAAET